MAKTLVKFDCLPAYAFQTPIGWCAVCGSDNTLIAATIGHPTDQAALRRLKADPRIVRLVDSSKANRWSKSLAARISAMLEGEPDDFRDINVDLDHLGLFTRRVVQACRKIAWGQTYSYADLASMAGSPGAARAVGQAMAGNRTPLVVPCHRVVASGGRLGGFSAPQGLKLKQWLLRLEQSSHGDSDSNRPVQGRFFSPRGKKFSRILA